MNDNRKERLEQVAQVNKIRKSEEISIKGACERVGITVATYNHYQYNLGDKQKKKKKRASKTAVVRVSELPQIEAPKPIAPMFLIYGAPEHLAAFARSYQ